MIEFLFEVSRSQAHTRCIVLLKRVERQERVNRVGFQLYCAVSVMG